MHNLGGVEAEGAQRVEQLSFNRRGKNDRARGAEERCKVEIATGGEG